MFEIKNNVIRITKGDTAMLRVDLSFINGEAYTLKTGDTLTLTVRKKPTSAILMQIVSTTNTITLPANSTKNLEVGNCVYDIELKTAANEIFTVVGLKENMFANMLVLNEVTYNAGE